MRFRIFTEPQEGATYDDQLAVALLAEELGFDAYFRSDHYIGFFNPPGLPGPTDAWITLAGLARDTSRLRLGTLVSPVTFRNPGPLAISVAQVDAMSGGRVELGLGAGWNDREHAGVRHPVPRHRRAVRTAWRSSSRSSPGSGTRRSAGASRTTDGTTRSPTPLRCRSRCSSRTRRS